MARHGRARAALTLLLVALLVCGCSAVDHLRQGSPLGDVVGEKGPLRDLKVPFEASNWMFVGDELHTLASRLTASGLTELAEQVRQTDPNSAAIVTIHYDACDKSDPTLHLNDGVVTVRFGTTIDRACYQAVDTMALVRVELADLPDPTTFRTCFRSEFAWVGAKVTGRPC